MILQMLEGYGALQNKATDEAGWIALKLSCSRGEAETAIAKARGESPTKRPKTAQRTKGEPKSRVATGR